MHAESEGKTCSPTLQVVRFAECSVLPFSSSSQHLHQNPEGKQKHRCHFTVQGTEARFRGQPLAFGTPAESSAPVRGQKMDGNQARGWLRCGKTDWQGPRV